jgi:16S rRNA (adenine1518-N6/adenine1519-N6)-dimethyltransferase
LVSLPRPRKSLGQHFLTQRPVLERIADALGRIDGRVVLEIGPGRGSLTGVLLERGARVTAIEKDRALAALLGERFPPLRVIAGDALEVDWRSVALLKPAEPLLITGNIPYNITSPLIEKALEPPRPEQIVFLVQEEVADRLVAEPGTRAYGALSVGVRVVARVEKLFRVKAGAFTPPPSVHSAVVRIRPLQVPFLEDSTLRLFRRMVTGLFGFRRKQLGRALRELTGWSQDWAAETLTRQQLDPKTRPETLHPDQFVRLFRVLVDSDWARG